MSGRRYGLTLAAVVLLIGATAYWAQTSDSAKVPPTTAASAANGAKQAATHSAAVTTPPLVPFIRTLSFSKASNKACPCPAVFQMQRALKAAKVRPAKTRSTGVFGKLTRDQIKAFQRKHKISPSGIYGSKTHHALSKFYDLAGRQRLQALAHDRKIAAITSAFRVVGAHFLLVGGNTLAYSESASRGDLGKYPLLPPATDCSGFVTAMFKAVGLPDPNGLNFRPVGWTGTLGLHGVRVANWAKLRIGDLVLYGGGYPYGHVAIVIDAARRLVLSHGSTGVRKLAFNYRRVAAIRRYY